MQVWIFWAAAGGMGAASLLAMTRSLWRGPDGSASPDLVIYRQQLDELDRDILRSAVPRDEAERLRVEISRRMLDANGRRRTTITRGRPWFAAAGLALGVAVSVPLYLHLGALGYPDLSLSTRIASIEDARAARPLQAEAEGNAPRSTEAPDPQYLDLVRQLRDAVARTPDDPVGLRLLARHEAALGRYADAANAQRRLLAVTPAPATEDLVLLAELMVRAANGYVSPEAEGVLTRILRISPEEPTALYLAGVMMAQGGRPDMAFRYLSRALDAAPDASWRPDILERMPDIAAQAGVRWTPPEPLGMAESIAALPSPQQAEAIRGMVDGLDARLTEYGGTAEEWARLVHSYGVLGRPDDARSAWLRGKDQMTTDEDRATLDAAATGVGFE